MKAKTAAGRRRYRAKTQIKINKHKSASDGVSGENEASGAGKDKISPFLETLEFARAGEGRGGGGHRTKNQRIAGACVFPHFLKIQTGSWSSSSERDQKT